VGVVEKNGGAPVGVVEKNVGVSGEKAVKNGLFQLRAGRRS
jgi:hypothetical protein